jgi:hypothetical protein
MSVFCGKWKVENAIFGPPEPLGKLFQVTTIKPLRFYFRFLEGIRITSSKA